MNQAVRQQVHIVQDLSLKQVFYRHLRGPDEEPDPHVCFMPHEVSNLAEVSGLSYGRLALESFEDGLAALNMGISTPEGATWYPVIPWIRDDGFYAIVARSPIPINDALAMCGLKVDLKSEEQVFKVAKRLQRVFAEHREMVFGRVVSDRMEGSDHHFQVRLDNQKIFNLAIYSSEGNWPTPWTDGMHLISPEGARKLFGRRGQIGELLQVTVPTPLGLIKGHALCWDIEPDFVGFDPKSELKTWGDFFAFGLLNELHETPAFTDIQSVINFQLYKCHDGQFLQRLANLAIRDVFAELDDEDALRESLGFYRPGFHEEETGDWKIQRLLKAGLPLGKIPFARRAIFRTMTDSPRRMSINGFRIPFRKLDPLNAQADLLGAATRRYLMVDPHVFDRQGKPTREPVLGDNQCFLSGFIGKALVYRNPNAHNQEQAVSNAVFNEKLLQVDQDAAIFYPPSFFWESKQGKKGAAQRLNGADLDDSVVALIDPDVIRHVAGLSYPEIPAPVKAKAETFDLSEFVKLRPVVYNDYLVQKALLSQQRNRTGIGHCVNPIELDTVITDQKDVIMRQLLTLPASAELTSTISWLGDFKGYALREVARRLEEIVDGINQEGHSMAWAESLIQGFMGTVPVMPEFWQYGGFENGGRVPSYRTGPHTPLFVHTELDTVRDELLAMRDRACQAAAILEWKRVWMVPDELRMYPTHPDSAQVARQAARLYYDLMRTKTAEFEKSGRDHHGKVVLNQAGARIAAYMLAQEEMHKFLVQHPLYLDAYTHLVMSVYDKAKPTSETRAPGEVIQAFPDGIIGGKDSVQGMIDALARAGVTRRFVPIVWDDYYARRAYGQARVQATIEDTLVCFDNRLIGTVELPNGIVTLDHGLMAAEDDRAPTQAPVARLAIVNGWEGRLRHARTPAESLALKQQLAAWHAQAKGRAVVKPCTYTNSKGESEPAARVYLEGSKEPLGWVARDYLGAAQVEIRGQLISAGGYTLSLVWATPRI